MSAGGAGMSGGEVWRAALLAQGVDPQLVERAEATAARLAAVARDLPSDPTAPAYPGELVPGLLAARENGA